MEGSQEEKSDYDCVEAFDTAQMIQRGKIPLMGTVLKFQLSDVSHLDNITLMKSDAATISVEELELEVSRCTIEQCC